MFCPECGTSLEEGSVFCPNCGAKVGETLKKVSPLQEGARRPLKAKRFLKPWAWIAVGGLILLIIITGTTQIGATQITERTAKDIKLIHTLKHEGYVASFAFSPDGRLLASGCEDKTARFWSVSDGQLVRTLKDVASSIAFSPDGQFLASETGRIIRLWGVK